MAAPSKSCSSLDAHPIKPQSLPPSFSSSSSNGSSRSSDSFPLSLNLAAPPYSATRARTFRFPPSSTPRGVSLVGEAPTRVPSLGPDKLQTLQSFRYVAEVDGGSLEVHLMAHEDVDATVKLLAESFADVMWIPPRQVRFLDFWVNQYLQQKRGQRPHAATLVGLYRGKDGAAESQLAGTAEVSFDAMGANDAPPTPAPPRDAPYICNMVVKKAFRRRHIGWHLLKACEELVLKMCSSTEVYLHCRVCDKGPLNMYKKADYMTVKTDSFLVWLRFQRRNHLMHKKLPIKNLEIS